MEQIAINRNTRISNSAAYGGGTCQSNSLKGKVLANSRQIQSIEMRRSQKMSRPLSVTG